MTSATDLVYGRRGGRVVDIDDGSPITQRIAAAPPCAGCGRPVLFGRRGMHYVCCAALGGREPVCNPVPRKKRDGGGTVCAHCWREAA